MRHIIRIHILCGILALVPFAMGIGEKYEEQSYSENELGYLYSIGAKSYLSIDRKNHPNWVMFTKKTEKASPFLLRAIREKKENYFIFVSGTDRDRKYCYRKKYINQGASSDYRGCLVLQVTTRDKKTLGVSRFFAKKESKFMVSPAVVPRLHAFRVYINKKCMTVQDNNTVEIEDCVYDEVRKKDAQLFMWVNKQLLEKETSPMKNKEDVDENPESPYYQDKKPYPISGEYFRN
ncbi:hypothetical protein NEFER03_2025 [Nematocida sp. LUAm3]|nr:hypothetical protein NEFER03_2025 [Nematocida sp. LUAm3]KAI5174499.1 hypothetical protein NEFER02_0620 [Nematocida sp. LUAm2]KAI5179150.1 hypothetical protein NEFER01_2013 [Nematocida sp. LUAm1]